MARVREFGTVEEESLLFWAKVQKSEGCWLWQGARIPGGYGVMRFQKKQQLTHRIVWQLTQGVIPKGSCVCHKCDNPPCVNPDHLFLGSHKDNMNDMHRKGRAGDHEWWKRPGRKHHRAVLTLEQASEIRKLYSDTDATQRDLASRFGVSQSAIWHILKGFSYS
jgi:DNA-binding XRE family transcriptional regulator